MLTATAAAAAAAANCILLIDHYLTVSILLDCPWLRSKVCLCCNACSGEADVKPRCT